MHGLKGRGMVHTADGRAGAALGCSGLPHGHTVHSVREVHTVGKSDLPHSGGAGQGAEVGTTTQGALAATLGRAPVGLKVLFRQRRVRA